MRIRTTAERSAPDSSRTRCVRPDFRNRMERVKRSTTNVAALYAKDVLHSSNSIGTSEISNSVISSRKSKNNSPVSTKPSPTSSASRPTSSATKPPSSKPPSKANSPKNGAKRIQMSSRQANSSNASSPNGEQTRTEKENTKNPPRLRPQFAQTYRKSGCLRTLDQLSTLITDGDHNPPPRVPVGIPHLTAKNIRNWQLDFQDCTYISTQDAKRVFKRYRPLAGDLIITCVGTLGRTVIVPEGIVFSPDRNLAAIRTVVQGVLTRYLQCFLNSPGIQQSLFGASGSTAQPHLYLGDLRQITVGLPAIAEQEQIVDEVERRLSVIRAPEAETSVNLQRAKRLSESILQRAFTGYLMTQKEQH